MTFKTFKTLKNIILLSFVAIFMSGAGCGNPATIAEIAAVSGLQLPKNIEVLQDDSAVASLAAVNSAAYNSAGTDYTDAKAEVWIDGGDWQNPLEMADMLMCIMTNTGANLLPNATYLGLIDMSQCDNEQGGSQIGKKTRFAEVSVVSSRVSNDSVQNVTAYFVDGMDQNLDGDITDAGETQHFATEAVITTGATSSNPYGVFTFNWNQANALTDDHHRGSLAFNEANTTQVGMTFVAEDKQTASPGAFDRTQWAKGELNKDGSGGKLKVYSLETPGPLEKTYKINFNSSFANIYYNDGNSESETCKNIDESAMTTYVFKYNLYDATTGALKDITAGLEFLHGTGKELRGWAGSYRDSNNAIKHWIWTEDGSAPTTIYKESDTTVSYSISWSQVGLFLEPTITGMTFDDPLRFTASFLDSAGNTRTDDLNYEGPGQLWGMNWSSDGALWSPQYNIADGTELTATDGTTWRVKQMGAWKTIPTVASSNCSALPVTDAEVAYTAPTLTAVTTTWADKPTITAKPRVIQGILQY